MATPQDTQFLSKSKLAGLLRQLLSFGVRLPDLSPFASVTNTTPAIILDVTKITSMVEGKPQLFAQLSRVQSIGQADIMHNHTIPYHGQFEFQCYCPHSTTGRKPSYQFWLNALGPDVQINGRAVEMNGILVNIMANSISFIETSFRTTGFHLFVHLHENYWPAVDRYIKWDEHFYPVGREKLQIYHVPDSFKKIGIINAWMDDIENYIDDDIDEQLYHQPSHLLVEGIENPPVPKALPRQRFLPGIGRITDEDAPNIRRSTGDPIGRGRPTSQNLRGRPRSLINPDGAKLILGHKRSSKLKENTLI